MNSLNNFDSYRLTEKNVLSKPKQIKRVKAAKILTSILLLLFIIIAINKVCLSLKSNTTKNKPTLIKPVPDLTFEDKIKNIFNSSQINVLRISQLNNSDYEVLNNKGLKILITKTKDLKNQLTSLQLILERFRIEGRQLKKVDLRFKNPIIE